jgi:DNA-binding response OmpR family regulator
MGRDRVMKPAELSHSGSRRDNAALSEHRLQHEGLLLFGDDHDLRRFLSRAFREQGYRVSEAASGDRPPEDALDSGCGCIVLDATSPCRDMVSVVRELRARGVTTPILMLTGHDEIESRLRGLEAGADDCLARPFDLRELLARVHALIRRASLRSEDSTLRMGELALDRLTRRVTRAGRPVDLTPREFALLEFLMRNAGRTVSRSRIAATVWHHQCDTGTNVIDVYVTYLRKKLAGEHSPILITAVRGVGYRLEAENAWNGTGVP